MDINPSIDSKWAVSNGYWLVACPECGGNGIFQGPDFEAPCNYCKTSGYTPISMMEGDLP